MRCWNCGRELPSGVGFCKYCGVQFRPVRLPMSEAAKTRRKSGSGLKIWFLIGGISSVFLIAIIVAAMIFFNKDTNQRNNSAKRSNKQSGELEPCTVKVYDSDGNLDHSYTRDAYDFTLEYFDANGDLDYRYELIRDSEDRLTERKYYNKNDELLNIEKFRYDENRAAVTKYDSPDAETGEHYDWVFDDKNMPIELTYYFSNGDKCYRIVYERDSHGNVIALTNYGYSTGEESVIYEEKNDIVYEGGRAVSAEKEMIYYKNDDVSSVEKNHVEYEY